MQAPNIANKPFTFDLMFEFVVITTCNMNSNDLRYKLMKYKLKISCL